MAGLIWSTKAIDDLIEIARSTEKISSSYSVRLIDKLLNKPDLLKTMPEMGRTVPEMEDEDPNIRELLEKPYRIIYRYREDTVTVLNVVTSHKPLK